MQRNYEIIPTDNNGEIIKLSTLEKIERQKIMSFSAFIRVVFLTSIASIVYESNVIPEIYDYLSNGLSNRYSVYYKIFMSE